MLELTPAEWFNCEMSIKRPQFLLLLMLLPGWVCPAQEKATAKLILKVDETVDGPLGGQKSSSCLRVYSDGKVLYASWRNSGMTIIDKETGKKSRPEKTISVEHHLENADEWELSSFLESKVLKGIPDKYAPPHRPIDYFENVTVRIISPNGRERQISTREFYVASLEEKSRYPSALILLMGKIDEIEKEANEKGKPTEIPSDCRLKPQETLSSLK